jgi:hypothetical protein
MEGHDLKQALRASRRRYERIAAAFDLDDGGDQLGRPDTTPPTL